MGNTASAEKENEDTLSTVVATPSTDVFPDTPFEQAKKEIDAELNQEGSLDELDFAGNLMGSKGGIYLASKLKNATKCVELDLRMCNLDDDAIQAIMENFPENVKVLLLRNNDITSKGASFIATFLSKNDTITCLDLSDNNVGDDGALALAKMLQSNKTLKDLDLFNNGIGKKGGDALSKVIKASCLKEFDISANDLDNEDEYAMESGFKSHLAGPSVAPTEDPVETKASSKAADEDE